MFFYLLKQFLIPLACCAAAFCMLFFISDVFDDLGDFLDAGVSTKAVVGYFLMKQPVNLVNVLPMSVLLAVSYVLANLGRHHELTAVRAAGVSMVRFCLPIWCTALALCLVLFWLNESVVPKFTVTSKKTMERLTEGESVAMNKKAKLAFHNEKEHRYWFFENFNPQGANEGVSVKQFIPNTLSLSWEIRADSAIFKNGVWIFKDGYRFVYQANERLPVGEEAFEKIEIENLSESPANIFSSLRPIEELTLKEILNLLSRRKMSSATRNIFWTAAWYKIAFPTSCLTAALLGVGFGMTKERTGALKGFATAVGLMVMFYVVNQSFVVLGKYGFLPPPIAGLSASLIFICIGCTMVYKRR